MSLKLLYYEIQIFSIFGAVSTLLGMAMSYLNTMVGNQLIFPFQQKIVAFVHISNLPQLYNLTLESFLGASYCLAAGFDGINMVKIFFFIIITSQSIFSLLSGKYCQYLIALIINTAIKPFKSSWIFSSCYILLQVGMALIWVYINRYFFVKQASSYCRWKYHQLS